MVGKYPEERQRYIDQSPIYKVHQIKAALAIYQGDEDLIVPPNQSVLIFEQVKKNGVPVSMIMYKGEQHGFRKSENIKKTLDTELYFFSKIFKFTLPTPFEHTDFVIHNLK